MERTVTSITHHHQTCSYLNAPVGALPGLRTTRCSGRRSLRGITLNPNRPIRKTAGPKSFRRLTPMSFRLRSLFLALHFFYRVFTPVSSRRSQLYQHEIPYPRKQILRRLAMLLASDDDGPTFGGAVLECLLKNIQRTVGWCRTGWMRKHTVYDRDRPPRG